MERTLNCFHLNAASKGKRRKTFFTKTFFSLLLLLLLLLPLGCSYLKIGLLIVRVCVCARVCVCVGERVHMGARVRVWKFVLAELFAFQSVISWRLLFKWLDTLSLPLACQGPELIINYLRQFMQQKSCTSHMPLYSIAQQVESKSTWKFINRIILIISRTRTFQFSS